MKSIGIIKRVDNLGRIVIPKNFRSFFGYGQNQEVEIFAFENGILLKKLDKEESANQQTKK